jgi:hypothetical protein
MSATVSATLQSIPEVLAAITAGESLFLAGSRDVLSQLPRGSWIGGTICYFMAAEGSTEPQGSVYATGIPEFALGADVADYGLHNLSEIYSDAPPNGFTFLVLPADTEVLRAFAQQAPAWTGFLIRPVVGWVSGVRVDRIGEELPVVFNGRTGGVFEDRCAALHVWLPPGKMANLDTANADETSEAGVLPFPEPGARARETAGDLVSPHRAPVARSADPSKPVFPGVDYRFVDFSGMESAGLARGTAALDRRIAQARNCTLNYLYGSLERRLSSLPRPSPSGSGTSQQAGQSTIRLLVRDIA